MFGQWMGDNKIVLELGNKESIERLNHFKTIKVLYGNTFAMHLEQLKQLQNDIETVLNLIQTEQAEIKEYKKIIAQDNKEYEHMKKSLKGIISRSNAEIEKKDNKLKDIKNHIKAELKMIDKLYNEVGWAGKAQYDGMKAAYKCVLNIYFENEVETEDK